MRNALILTLGATILLTGCADEAAQKQAQNRKEIAATLDQFKQSQTGYVPKGQGVGATDEARASDLEGYRIKVNSEAAAKLKKQLNDMTPELRASALMVIANTDLQAALIASRDARIEGARVCASAVGLLGRLASATESQALAGTYKKHADGAALRDLSELQKRFESELEQQKALAEQLTKDAQALQTEAESLGSQADGLSAKVRDLKQQAFVKTGREQIDLYKQAAELEIQASRNTQQRQLKLARRDIVVSQLAVAMSAQNSLQQSVQVTEEQVKTLQARQRELETKIRGLNSSSAAAVASISDLYNELETNRKKSVEAGFKVAIERAKAAVESMEQAVQLSSGKSAQERYYKLDLLGKREILLDIIVQQLAFDQDYTETLGLVTKAAAEQGVQISDALIQGQQILPNDQKALGPDARALHDSSAALVTELTQALAGSEDEPMAGQVRDSYNRIQALGNALRKLVPQDV